MILEFLLTILVLSPLLFIKERPIKRRVYTDAELIKIQSQMREIENIKIIKRDKQ